jgi:hypothetical protein
MVFKVPALIFDKAVFNDTNYFIPSLHTLLNKCLGRVVLELYSLIIRIFLEVYQRHHGFKFHENTETKIKEL